MTPDTCILAETGDSWFNALKLNLPKGSGFEVQMRYGSIGWSVGATLGYSLGAAADGKRLISMIGDGSFQMTAQVRVSGGDVGVSRLTAGLEWVAEMMTHVCPR